MSLSSRTQRPFLQFVACLLASPARLFNHSPPSPLFRVRLPSPLLSLAISTHHDHDHEPQFYSFFPTQIKKKFKLSTRQRVKDQTFGDIPSLLSPCAVRSSRLPSFLASRCDDVRLRFRLRPAPPIAHLPLLRLGPGSSRRVVGLLSHNRPGDLGPPDCVRQPGVSRHVRLRQVGNSRPEPAAVSGPRNGSCHRLTDPRGR